MIMSVKNMDNHNRWRNRTVAFRVSEEENVQIDLAVKLTGLTKQDYITRRLLCKDVVVQGNPRVFKALRDQLNAASAYRLHSVYYREQARPLHPCFSETGAYRSRYYR